MSQQIDKATSDKNIFGFWVYLMTDCMLFATLFATFVVLRNGAYHGPSSQTLFSLPYVLLESLILLTSSFTCGLATLALRRRDKTKVLLWFLVTFLLGTIFLGLELSEFASLVMDGHGWKVNGFLSAYFTLVGTHGLHILAGLLWMAVLLVGVARHGLRPQNEHHLTMLSLYWHFLDIIWIFIFMIVYLIGARS